MSSFRPILPAGNINVSEASESGGSFGKKRDAVNQACHACRKAKTKCVYDSEDVQSKAALRSRIEALEQQVGQASTTRPQSQPSPTFTGQAPSVVSQRFLPSVSVTQQAVEGFFSSSGTLFHVFTRSQVSVFMDSVWKNVDIGSQSWRADVCCLMAIAAVGMQYNDTTGDTDASDSFYDISKAHFDSALEMRPLDAIKICTLLCMYNVMSRAVASLAYADIGLALCRRFGLYNQRRQLPSLTDSMWDDYRKAWRTLMFLSTWLSATLGYRSRNQHLFEQISPSDLSVDDTSDISEVAQTGMVRVAVLKLKILYMHLVHKDLGWATSAMAQDLEKWYDGLPNVIHLQETSTQALPLEVRRTIYMVHLIYLGTNILLFRRIAFQILRWSKTHGALPAPWQPSREQYLKQADEASLAANGSARLIRIMMDDNCVFKRCWIIIFQSYISCLTLLYNVLGKIALNTPPSDYEEDLGNIRSCLGALSFCGSVDHVAARFHSTLSSIYNSLINNHVNKPPIANPDADTGYQQLITVEEDAAANATLGGGSQEDLHRYSSYYHEESLKELSTNLLSMLCRPFGDPINKKDSKEYVDIDEGTIIDQTGQHSMGRLDWDFEDNSPFPWDTTGIGTSDDQIEQLGRSYETLGTWTPWRWDSNSSGK